MADETEIKKTIKRLSAEDIVIVVSIVLTLMLAPLLSILWFLDDPVLVPPPIISIFLGIAVSALLYRFLGGVHDASFTVGALKVTGTAAILIFVAGWANSELKQFIPEGNKPAEAFEIAKHVIPAPEKWYAVNRETGNPIALEFPSFGQKHDPPSANELNAMREKRVINLKGNPDEMIAYLNNGGNRVLGKISPAEINRMGYFRDIKIHLIPYRVVTLGSKQKEDINANLPFLVETRGFAENYTRYALISRKDNREIHEGAILLRGAEVVEYENRYYLISVVQVNHGLEDVEPYAKIYIAEIHINRV